MALKQHSAFLTTPPLWTNTQFGIQQFDFPEMDLTGFKAEPIPMKIRLGHQMEYVFKQLIAHSGKYEVLLHNLPIKKDNRTIGEIDFILREVLTEKRIHVELTYKFYIIDPEISEPIHRLMGPNKRDMFFTKIEKIKNEQFELLHSEEGAKALYDKEIEHSEIEHEACYKAQLFIPYGSTLANIRPLNKNCICGHWLRFDEFNSNEFKSHQFYIPYKSEWVMAPHAAVHWSSHHETLLEVNLSMHMENAPMVWMKKSETEFEKFFVVFW
ncbi:DUF1853 family protein [Maribacter halichondriae]|uniref:DUF1853 family protein n=1 Tax=Maribacter halichondriae TaxID=2980554 RepID=UPI002358508E|nr:DUF1853 family protein [Maribacter sp. Hal144]